MEKQLETRINKAIENYKSGMNCSQSVATAYADLLGVDERTMFMVAEGFGAGMGMKSVCGAVTGMFMLLGLKNSSGNPEIITKAQTLKLVNEAAQKFKDENGSLLCAELKSSDNVNGKPVNCMKCIEDACKIFEEYLSE